VSNPDGQSQDIVSSVCKETCSENDCNTEITVPDYGGNPNGPDSHHYCHSCSVILNHLNQTVGNGDIRTGFCYSNYRQLNSLFIFLLKYFDFQLMVT
jgi:hypothetical protein